MTTAYYSGKTGSITLPGISTLAVKSWTADHEQELVDVTNKGSAGYHESIAGLQKLSGSADCLYDGEYATLGTSGSATLTNADSTTITATVFVTKVGYESGVDGAVTVKLDWEATGSFSVGSS